jgi:hypothetical protein
MTDLAINLAGLSESSEWRAISPVANSAGTGRVVILPRPINKTIAWILAPQAAGTKIDPGLTAPSSQHQGRLELASTELQDKLRARWPRLIKRARELEQHIPDPVKLLADLLGNLPGDYPTWREIVEEPYG